MWSPSPAWSAANLHDAHDRLPGAAPMEEEEMSNYSRMQSQSPSAECLKVLEAYEDDMKAKPCPIQGCWEAVSGLYDCLLVAGGQGIPPFYRFPFLMQYICVCI